MRKTWLCGGILLVAGAVLNGLPSGTTPGAWLVTVSVIHAVVIGVSFVLFAYGANSVVRRRAAGVSLLTVLAVWPLLVFLIGYMLTPLAEQPGGAAWASRIGFLLQDTIPARPTSTGVAVYPGEG